MTTKKFLAYILSMTDKESFVLRHNNGLLLDAKQISEDMCISLDKTKRYLRVLKQNGVIAEYEYGITDTGHRKIYSLNPYLFMNDDEVDAYGRQLFIRLKDAGRTYYNKVMIGNTTKLNE